MPGSGESMPSIVSLLFEINPDWTSVNKFESYLNSDIKDINL